MKGRGELLLKDFYQKEILSGEAKNVPQDLKFSVPDVTWNDVNIFSGREKSFYGEKQSIFDVWGQNLIGGDNLWIG